jgi:hypothetical protein
VKEPSELLVEHLRRENAQMQRALKECARVLPSLVNIAKEADYPDNLAEIRAGRIAARMALAALSARTDAPITEELAHAHAARSEDA